MWNKTLKVKKLKCPSCGESLRHEGAEYCPNCGVTIPKDFWGESTIHHEEKNREHETVDIDDNIDDVDVKPKSSKHTLEFVLTLIAFILTIVGILIALINFSYYHANISMALLSAIIGLFGAIIIRYFPRIGAVFSIIAGLMVFLTRIPLIILIILFYTVSAVLCYVRK